MKKITYFITETKDSNSYEKPLVKEMVADNLESAKKNAEGSQLFHNSCLSLFEDSALMTRLAHDDNHHNWIDN